MSEVKEHVLRQLRRIPVKNKGMPSVEADASPQESSMAVEASRHVAPAEIESALRVAFPHFSGEPITAERIKSIGREYLEMVSGWEPSKTKIDFMDQEGQMRTIVFEVGDYWEGSSSCWVIPEGADWQVSRVSDEQPKAEDPKGLSAQHASAAASAETPFPPSPSGEVEKAIEATVSALKGASVTGSGGYLFVNVAAFKDLVRPALTTYAEDNERLRLLTTGEPQDAFVAMFKDLNERLTTAQAEIERLRAALIKAGNNLGGCLSDEVSTDFLMSVPTEAYLIKERLTASQAKAEEMRKALEECLTFLVLLIAFVGRDQGTDRFEKTMESLIKTAVELDPKIRTALMKGGE